MRAQVMFSTFVSARAVHPAASRRYVFQWLAMRFGPLFFRAVSWRQVVRVAGGGVAHTPSCPYTLSSRAVLCA